MSRSSESASTTASPTEAIQPVGESVWWIPSLLLALLAVAGLAVSCLQPEQVKHALTFGQGKLAVIVSGWFGLPWFIDMLRCTCGGLMLTAAGLTGLRAPLRRATPFLYGSIGPSWGWLAVTVVVALWQNGQTLRDGFFKIDDFILLREAQLLPLAQSLLVLHYDSPQLLLRAVTWGMLRLFGVDPLPYNIALQTLFTLTGFAGLLLLRQAKASRLAGIAFLLLFFGWSNWGEISAGYYMLSQYLFNLLAGFLCATLLLRWHETGNRKTLFLLLALLLLGSSHNLAGSYLPCAMLALHLCLSWRRTPPARNGKLLWPLIATLLIVAGIHATLLHVSDGISLQGNKGGMPLSHAPRAVADMIRFGVLLPTAGGQAGAYLRRFGLLWHTGLALSLLSLAGLALLWKSSVSDLRRVAAACLIGAMGVALMTVLGRRFADPGLFCQVKYTGQVFGWGLIGCASLLGGGAVKEHLRPLFLHGVFAALALYLAVQYTADAAGTHGAAHIYGGRGYHWRQGRERNAALERLKQAFAEALGDSHAEPLVIPTLTGAALLKAEPSLWGYDLSWLTGFILPGREVTLLRTPEMKGHFARNVETVTPDELRRRVSPEFLTALQRSPKLRTLYEAQADAMPGILPALP